jgi:pimeloyl-ACP methyl ester carboxylesterase
MNSSVVFDLPDSETVGLARALLQAGFAVYTYDQRGAGESSVADWDFGLYEHAFVDFPAVVRFVLTHTQSDKVILGGYSLGGLIIYLFTSYLAKTGFSIRNLTSANIHKVFTIAAPALFHKRTGKWKHLFERAEKVVKTMDLSIDAVDFIKGQIYARSPFLNIAMPKAVVRTGIDMARASVFLAGIVRSLPIPVLVYRRSDFDAETFCLSVRSKVLDRASAKIILDLVHFGKEASKIELTFDDQAVRLPDDISLWEDIPLLMFASHKDDLVLSAEVEKVARVAKKGEYIITDDAFGNPCGHFGYLIKKGLRNHVADRIVDFLI